MLEGWYQMKHINYDENSSQHSDRHKNMNNMCFTAKLSMSMLLFHGCILFGAIVENNAMKEHAYASENARQDCAWHLHALDQTLIGVLDFTTAGARLLNVQESLQHLEYAIGTLVDFGYWNRMFRFLHSKPRLFACAVGVLNENNTNLIPRVELHCPLPSDMKPSHAREVPLDFIGRCMKANDVFSHYITAYWYLSFSCDFDMQPPELKRAYPVVDNPTTESVTQSNELINTTPIETSLETDLLLDTQTVIVNDEVTSSILCIYDYGSVLRKPKLHFCKEEKYAPLMKSLQHCEQILGPIFHVEQVTNPEQCYNNREAGLLKAQSVSWVLAKINYGLVLSTCLLITGLMVLWRHYSRKRYRKKFFLPFLVTVNVMWLLWRLQETLQWESRWRDDYAYLCMVTNSVCYLSETQSLYLFAYSSLERYHAVAAPLMWLTFNKTRARQLAILMGGIIGIIGSLLNIIFVFLVNDSTIMKICTISQYLDKHLMNFLIAIKIINLVCVYCLPCVALTAANIAIIFAGKHKRRQIRSSRKQPHRVSYVYPLLTFSSLFMLCCLPRPIFDLKLTFDMVHTGEVTMNAREIVTDGIIWNLATLAFALNTVMGMRYAA